MCSSDPGEEPTRKAAKVSTKAAPHAGGASTEGVEGRGGLVQRMSAYDPGELLPAQLIRQFVSYTRQHCHPQLTHGAKLVIKEFYLQLRQQAAMQKAVCVTVCAHQSCCEAHYTTLRFPVVW
jgi:DNA replicative helicase MCM subunit Mcm2 (Cdc46/Mcm family)